LNCKPPDGSVREALSVSGVDVSLRLSFPKEELQTQLKVTLAQYDLDRAAFKFFGQSQDGADSLSDCWDPPRPGDLLPGAAMA
jgi:hypothetical protein